jgi:hypothetical protein
MPGIWQTTQIRAAEVDLTAVTVIDGAGRYLPRLMEAKSVTLEGGGIGIRALLDDRQPR